MVDFLLRVGADETIVGENGLKASDLIGAAVEEERRLAEDFERVRKLLANVPADRAWRRRGYLVLFCHAHPDRVQQNRTVISGTHHADTAWTTGIRAELARAGRGTGDIAVDEGTGGDWAVVVAKALSLQEEGIFQTIVGYL